MAIKKKVNKHKKLARKSSLWSILSLTGAIISGILGFLFWTSKNKINVQKLKITILKNTKDLRQKTKKISEDLKKTILK